MSASRREEEEEEQEQCIAALQLCYSNIFPRVLKAAFDLGVFEVLAAAGGAARLTAFEVAGKLPGCSKERAAAMFDHILGFLAAHSLLTCTTSICDGEGRSWKQYGLTPASRLLAMNQDGISLGPLLLMLNQNHHGDCWDKVKEAVQEGVNPFQRAHGMTFYEFLAKNPSRSNEFNEAMASHSNIVMEKIIEQYDGLKQVMELVDVAGGIGTSLKKIISKYPHIKGINFDQPHVISMAPSLPGVQHVSGDMFTKIPNGRAILIKWILSDWNDEKCLIILKNCWRALPTSGKVIIVQQILPDFPEANICTQHIYTMNIVMAVFLNSKERTEKEYRSLAEEAGFSEFKVSLKVLSFSVMEFVKWNVFFRKNVACMFPNTNYFW